MDFVIGLPLTPSKKDSVWVIVDRLTKSAHFIPVRVDYSLQRLAKLYVAEIVRLHGVPGSQIHVEVLESVASGFGYKTGFQHGISSTVRWIVGRGNPDFRGYAKGLCFGFPGLELVTDTEDKVKLIRARLKEASDRQKSYADLKRRDIEFAVGDKVFLKVSPWKKVLRFGRKGKLSPRFIGSYKVLKRAGPVAYQLELPPELS
ncbi:DNA/RNA polymerases superfamily protein [Gossypium australe]|uniref:DNA/RNA polymerases superfamily protein n=1 Tax=Gossypium australe TaxID=47621 RepID=A0A5B6UWM4_9ROSI|nr:DNA/RNA polymerases superfamily protein [Gossypium australe]